MNSYFSLPSERSPVGSPDETKWNLGCRCPGFRYAPAGLPNNGFLVTKLSLVMPARQAQLDERDEAELRAQTLPS